ncbi:hypothetical protein JTB14_013671 [Gonioctena quinquepunctata]|nr:hypothetical protein JTB14_013671 [Gonioctena quinquepunctata]
MELRMQNCQEIFFTEDIDMKVDILSNNIKSVFDRHAPLRKVRSTKPRAPWMTNNLKIMKKQRNKLLAKYKSTKNLDYWEAYKRARNDFTAAVRTEKQNYLNEIHRTKKNRKDTWKAFEHLNIHSKKSDISLPPDLNEAEAINCHFINSVNECQVDDDLVQYYNTHKVNYNLDHCRIETFREHDVLEAVDSIKSNTEGSDGITLHMIKMCCFFLLPFIAHIFNCCLLEGYFPINWRNAVILPLPKVSNPKCLSDLRPISRLPVLSKMFKRLIFNEFLRFLTENELFSDCQSGFRLGIVNLTKVLDDIFQQLMVQRMNYFLIANLVSGLGIVQLQH